MIEYECGFAAVNDGEHCYINGHCVVCKEEEKVEKVEKIPNPGSKLAVEKGCTCPVYDNHHGMGIPGEGGKPNFWITGGCPLHDTGVKK